MKVPTKILKLACGILAGVAAAGVIGAAILASVGSKEHTAPDPAMQAALNPFFKRHGVHTSFSVSRKKRLGNETLVIRFIPSEESKRAFGYREAILLPMTIAGHVAVRSAPEIDAVEIFASNDREDIVRMKTRVEDIREFIGRRIDRGRLAGVSEFEVTPWKARGATPEERAREYLERGRIFAIQKQDLNTALACYEAAAGESPSNVDAHYSVGVMKLNLNDAAGAAAAVGEALRLNPDDHRSHACMAMVKISLKDSQGALGHLARFEQLRVSAREQNIFNEAAYHRAVHSYRQLGRAESALALARECAGLYPESADSQLLLGTVLFAQKRRSDALKTFQRMIQLPSGNPSGWQSAAWHLNELKDYKNAALAGRRSYSLGNREAQIFLGLSFAYLNLGRYFDAKHVLIEGLKAHPGDRDLENNFRAAHRNIVKKRLRPSGPPTPIPWVEE